ncbi:hypothetical protein [Chitinophaga lutea]|nr:hypothetical protein [Chitinophaga lutea]
MARQIGLMQLEGTIGNMTFYKSKDGYFARQKAASKTNNSDRTRENMNEFARAVKAGKMIRTAFATIIRDVKDSYITRRLNQSLNQVVKTDTLSARGMRNIIEGDISLLQGFEFNSDMALSSALLAPYTTEINRTTGTLKVGIAPFVPAKLISAPEGATHYRFTIAGAMVNFLNGDQVTAMKASDVLPLANQEAAPLSLEVQVPAASTGALMLALGLSFFQEVNGVHYPVGELLNNALALVAVAGPEK